MKKRKIFTILLKQKEEKKISFLLGARQVGKTTLLLALYDELCVLQKQKGAYLDLDIFSNFEKISSFEALVNYIILQGYEKEQKSFFYLFLDEFQRYGDLSRIMKNVYDTLPNVKIYASGSSSLHIKSQIQESLAGRKKVNHIYPLDFEEFLWFKEENDALEQFKNTKRLKGEDLEKTTSKLHKLLSEFLLFGGYPELVLKKRPEEKIAVLESIFDLYVRKDLIEYLNVKNILGVKKLIEYIAVNNGQKIKYEEIGKISGLGFIEVLNYLEILKETYLISIIRPFFTNKNKELVKIPKIYFIDSGVRNYFIKNFNALELRQDSGFLFETYVFSELLKAGNTPEQLKFWQDKNKHEVDVILDKVQMQIPIEIKWKYTLKREDISNLHIFMQNYSVKKGYIINLGVQKKKKSIILKLPYDFQNL